MFGLSMADCRVRSIGSYAGAVAIFDAGSEIRGRPGQKHIPGKSGSRVMYMHMDAGAVHFRYHSTDVVTWYADDTYRLDCWGSNATDRFANRFTPPHHFMTGESSILYLNDTAHPVRTFAKVSADGRLLATEGSPKFAQRVVDRARAKSALAATNYKDYRDWYNVTRPMLSQGLYGHHRSWFSRDAAIDALSDRTLWFSIMCSDYGTPERMRRAIYDEHDCYTTKYVDSLPCSANVSLWSVRWSM